VTWLNSKMCAGCQKDLPDNIYYYRSKTFCGSEECKVIIDGRRASSNRKKKDKRKQLGSVYRGVNSNIRRKIVARDEGKCALCNSEIDVQVHHIVPSSEGGRDDHDNLICLCDKDHTKVHKNLVKYSDKLSKIANGRENVRKQRK
jgi:5-methylcytosine-specific restriction endonuclease McrA